MKNFLLATGLILASSVSMAGEMCTVQGHAAILSTTGTVLNTVRITSAKFKKRTKNWQDCYQMAIDKARDSKTSLLLEVTRPFLGTVTTEAPVYFSWSYDDSLMFDSSGEVTSFTDQYAEQPEKGQQCYRADGSVY
ncbi:MAG: hypothetical protein ACLGG0_06915 [Bacteriovoracia bacterium]